MSGQVERIERILNILSLLTVRARNTIEIIDALAGDYRFDWHRYSKETVWRDIRKLREAGFAIDCAKKTGVYELKSVPIRLDFEPGEIVALAIACRSIPEEAGLPYARELAGALAKISSLLSPEGKEKLTHNICFQLQLDSVVDYRPHQDTIERIRQAIAAGNEIEIDYFSSKSNKERRRVVAPYQLYFSGGGVRLQGYCHLKKQVLEFRVDRIRKLEVLPGKFDAPTTKEPVAFKLWLDPKLSRSIGQRFLNQEIHANDDGSSILIAEATSPFHLILQILSYGERAELLEPAYLREEMATIAKRMAEIYSCD